MMPDIKIVAEFSQQQSCQLSLADTGLINDLGKKDPWLGVHDNRRETQVHRNLT